jgi:hypothetical protein
MSRLREGTQIDCGADGIATVIALCRESQAVTIAYGSTAKLLVPATEINDGRCNVRLNRQGFFIVGTRPRRTRGTPDTNCDPHPS